MLAFLGIPDLDRPAPGSVAVVPLWVDQLQRFVPRALTGATLSGFTANQVPVGTSTGGLAGSSALTFNGTTLAITGAATISTTLGVTGVASFTNTTDASDSATAALVVTGGVAMAKNLWVGANAAAGIALYLNCAAANGAQVKFMSANVLRWQMGRVGSTHDWRIEGYDSGGSLTDIPLTIANAAGGAFTIVRPVAITSGTASTSTTTGALIVTGGVGIGGALSVGGAINGAGNATFSTSGGGTATVKTYTNAAANALVGRYNDSNSLGGFYVDSSGEVFFGGNVDISGGNNTYSRGSVAPCRFGNPNGTGNIAFEVNVAAAGSAAATITWTRAFFVYATGSVALGPLSALATNATDGFTYMPTCAGTPSGTPTAVAGKVAWVYDTTNNKIYVYNGAWKATAALT